MNIVFCCDVNCEIELNVAAYSVLKHSSALENNFIVVTDKPGSIDRQLLQSSLSRLSKPFTVRMEVFVPTISLDAVTRINGSYMTYARLFLCDLLGLDRFMYLDTDVLCTLDLAKYYAMDIRGCPIGSVYERMAGEGGDRELLKSLGAENGDAYFIAAVLLFDAVAWKQQGCFSRCAELIAKYGAQLAGYDQTILNVVLRGHWHPLPERLCSVVPFHSSPKLLKGIYEPGCIFHYIFRPKPWELLWPRLVRRNNNYKTWFQYLHETGLVQAYRQRYRLAGRVLNTLKELWSRTKRAKRSLAAKFRRVSFCTF